ncbi:MAG: DNA translocase FtsK [Ruminococcaceae bacterium]|nr:DNA translocase FtsK [Oscillospiraceae bacterium]
MAKEKTKSQAQKAAAKRSSGKSGSKSKSQKSGDAKTKIPVRLITSLVSLGMFVLFLVMFLWPRGIIVEKGLLPFIKGLIGNAGFYVAIPALLYLFGIQAFSGKRPVILRSVCLICFVLICGCLLQLSLPVPQDGTVGGKMAALYVGGSTGATAGLLCGGVALLLEALCGIVITYIIFIIAAILTLLASMQITIPSIVRAVQNRPRADWEDDQEEVQEPAAVVVNHLANKRIERVENRRRTQAEREELEAAAAEEEKKQEKEKPVSKKRKKADDLMSQIDSDVEQPVAAASQAVVENVEVDLILSAPPAEKPTNPNVSTMEPVPEQMPLFEKSDEPVDSMPIAEPAPAPAPVAEVKLDKITAKDAAESAAEVAAEIAQAESVVKPEYCYPPIELLKNAGRSSSDGTMEMRENTRRLNETLASFKIEAHIINVTRGPSVTRYEVELDKGVRLNKLTSCADDIALSLGASGVRIAAVPGKISVVGIEVPNRAVTTVSLREVIDSNEFSKARSKSSFAVGKDISGNSIVGNIAKLPHMLIAGTTGSGKSVCMNSIIISLLYKASPEDVKLIMVDPKMVELGIYNGIPHLLIPVVTDPKKAAGSLQWAVTEMMRRYKTMSDAGVRDLESYNSIVEAEEEGSKLPQVVVIIDELADLMLVAAKEVEESICRIAQMGRAAGIHLIIATQRPSADVITGLMKANIPSRIAFAVASAMESRIILDTMGAEKLVGRGDMLYAPIGAGKPLRVQGCFVSDPEVEAVANYVKDNFNTSYDQQVMEEIERKAAQAGSGKAATAADPEPTAAETDGDELLPAAVDVILETNQASVSMLQRRLKLGYARAARIVDEMEEKGIVGPFQGSKPREILVTKEQWAAMKSGQSSQMAFDDLDDGGVPEELM